MSNARRAVVTGSSSGIGRAIAARLLNDGWKVVGLDAASATIVHAAFEARQVDLTATPAIPLLARGLQGMHALVHAAGIMHVGRLDALDPHAMEAMWRVNVDAAMALAAGLTPSMPDGGRIVLVGSRASSGIAGRSQYAATKAALVAAARSWAAELIGRGITVNVVAPAATDTPMIADPARGSEPPKLPPIGRLIRPEEVAALVAFLLSDEAGAITGQEIKVCGGASL